MDHYLSTGNSNFTYYEGNGNNTVDIGSGTGSVTVGTGTDVFNFTKGSSTGDITINDFKLGTDMFGIAGFTHAEVQNILQNSVISNNSTILSFSANQQTDIVGVTGITESSFIYK